MRKIISLKLRLEELEELEIRWRKWVERTGDNISRHRFMKIVLLGRKMGQTQCIV